MEQVVLNRNSQSLKVTWWMPKWGWISTRRQDVARIADSTASQQTI